MRALYEKIAAKLQLLEPALSCVAACLIVLVFTEMFWWKSLPPKLSMLAFLLMLWVVGAVVLKRCFYVNLEAVDDGIKKPENTKFYRNYIVVFSTLWFVILALNTIVIVSSLR